MEWSLFQLSWISRWQQCGKSREQEIDTLHWTGPRQQKKRHDIRYFLQPLMSFFSLLCDAYILACSWSEYNKDYVFFFSHFRCNQNAHTLKKYKMQNKHTSLEQLFACACGWFDCNLQYPSLSHRTKQECWVTSVAWCYWCSTSRGWRPEWELSTSRSDNECSHTQTYTHTQATSDLAAENNTVQ